MLRPSGCSEHPQPPFLTLRCIRSLARIVHLLCLPLSRLPLLPSSATQVVGRLASQIATALMVTETPLSMSMADESGIDSESAHL